MIPRMRTALVALLVAVIALRWSLSQPVSAVTARIATDPWAAVRSAGDGWTFVGTLGGSTVEGLRELPFALALAVGTEVGLSAHTVETCWRILVLVVAVLGAVHLARTLASRSGRTDSAQSWAPWTGAVFFVLGTVLVPTSVLSPVDALAAATLPWVVAPLFGPGRGWRAAAASAAWLGLAGVGSAGWAVAAFVVGGLAVVPRRRADLALAWRWLVLAAAASAWWWFLLVWETRHTVDVAALSADTLRAQVAAAVGRTDLALLLLVAVVAGSLVIAVGALALRSPQLERFFVAASLVVVAAVVLLVWVGDWRPHVPAPASGVLPAGLVSPALGVLGLAGLVAWCPLVEDLRSRLAWTREGRLPTGGREVAGTLVAVLATIAVCAGITATVAEPAPESAEENRLLDAVADWSASAPAGRVLVMPVDTGGTDLAAIGSALGARPWIGRDDVPTSGAAGTTALDDLVARLGRGDAGPGTSSALRRLGVTYVLVRLGGPVEADRDRPTALVRASLDSLGAQRLAVLPAADGPEALIDFGVRTSTPLVEVWAPRTAADGWAYAGPPIDAVGDAGTVSDLASAGVLGDRAVVLRPGSGAPAVLVSDSARRRDVDQRVATDPYGPDLGIGAPRSVVPADAAPVTSAYSRLEGARAVTASSSAADLDASDRDPTAAPVAGIDGNPFTSWRSRPGSGVGQWWQVDLGEPTPLSGTSIRVLRNAVGAGAAAQVLVSTDGDEATYPVGDDGLVVLDDVGEVRRLRITVTAVNETYGERDSVGIVEVSVPDVEVRAPLALDHTPAPAWLMALRPGSTAHCVPAVPRGTEDVSGTACNGELEVSGPDGGVLDRVVFASRPTPVVGRAWLVASSTQQAASLADGIAGPSVVASSDSVAAADLRTRPQAAADADPTTAWRPAAADREPRLTLSWRRPAELSAVRLIAPEGDPGSRPTRVRVEAEQLGRRTGEPVESLATEVDVEDDGTIDLPRVYTRELAITILEDTDVPTADSTSADIDRMPVAVGEVELVGGPPVRYDANRSERLGCDQGPPVSVDGVEYGTSMRVTPREIVRGMTVLATVCGRPVLGTGENDVTLRTTFDWWARGLLLAARSSTVMTTGAPAAVAADLLGRDDHSEPVTIDLGTAPRERTLALALPADPGWRASVDGEDLDAVTLDGWAQGWVVPAGDGEVTVRYTSGEALTRGALVASAGWLLVVLLATGLGVLGAGSAIRRPRERRPDHG